jgi:hypothetical protein
MYKSQAEHKKEFRALPLKDRLGWDPVPKQMTEQTTEVTLPTPEEFSLEVENRVWSDKDEDSYIYHTTKYLEELNLEAEDGKKLISAALLDKIKNEAMEGRLLKERITTSSVLGFE